MHMAKPRSMLIAMTSLRTGGVATSIHNLIAALPENEYSIDLLLFDRVNSDGIPDRIKKIDAGKYVRLVAISQRQAAMESIWLACYKGIMGIIARIWGHGVSYRLIFKRTRALPQEYDVAISFTQSAPKHRLYGGCNEFVLEKVSAKQKIAFIHCDYESLGLANAYSHSIYSRFDAIAAVSESVRNGFLKCEPTLAAKTHVVYNFQNYQKIVEMANADPVVYEPGAQHFITVARMRPEKGHARMLPIVQHLSGKGIQFVWHIVGEDEATAPADFIHQMNALGVDHHIRFHGNQGNPYRFIKNADFLFIPSHHEAAPMVYSESNCLGVPVVTTETLSAKELVEAKKIGIVCKNDEASIEAVLEKVLTNPNGLRKRVKQGAPASNEEAYQQFEALLNLHGREDSL